MRADEASRRRTVFEYQYRDSGNWKTSGQLLLLGEDPRAGPVIRGSLDWGDQFVAEQVGVPSLCSEHWAAMDADRSELDHAYHEFIALRPATAAEMALSVHGPLDRLVVLFARSRGRWDVRLSPNCEL